VAFSKTCYLQYNIGVLGEAKAVANSKIICSLRVAFRSLPSKPYSRLIPLVSLAIETPGYWQQYSGGWAWVDRRWSWGTQGEGE
jgi:hypothetical protein